jgi:hypothetical protein
VVEVDNNTVDHTMAVVGGNREKMVFGLKPSCLLLPIFGENLDSSVTLMLSCK